MGNIRGGMGMYLFALVHYSHLHAARFAEALLPQKFGELASETETPNISVHQDFLKCVQILVFFKTQICTENVSRYHRHCTDLCF